MSTLQQANALVNEKSPYLLQHAHNPVDWFPWGMAAFKKAVNENKPVFLSIGYSTCHWCHVMEHESFQDPDIAKLLNDHFVAIKVDREERPDIDSVYMTVCQMITGSGGWPLTIMMTPEKKPFFAATYIPKTSRFGRKGLLELLPEVNTLWTQKNAEVLQSAENISTELIKLTQTNDKSYLAHPANSQNAFKSLHERFDKEHGGFGNAPKFPSPHILLFLLNYWQNTKNPMALNMVETTLTEMGRGGIYDQIGYGFHRYSTDKDWRVPHFEKMLYDQAMLILAYIETWQATGKNKYKTKVEEIAQYVLRDMTHGKGGFFSAEDADSEGVEGKFYVWGFQDLLKSLTSKDLQIAITLFNIKTDGNYPDEATREYTGKNILYREGPVAKTAEKLHISEQEIFDRLDIIRTTLFQVREKRVHPLKDDKILTDWNGLLIAALAKSGALLSNKKHLDAAENAAQFILQNMIDNKGRLLHRYRGNSAGIPAFLDDYAFFIWGLIELYNAEFNPEYLVNAIELIHSSITLFWDSENNGFYNSAHDHEKLLLKTKEVYDGAIPSGNSVMFMNLLRLARMVSSPELEEKASSLEKSFAKQINRHPSAHCYFITVSEYAMGNTYEIIIAGDPQTPETQAMINTIRQYNIPNVMILRPMPEKDEMLENILPWINKYKTEGPRTTVYICKNFQCNLPVTNIHDLKQQLDELQAL